MQPSQVLQHLLAVAAVLIAPMPIAHANCWIVSATKVVRACAILQ